MRLWSILLVLTALAFPVEAGNADDPEVTDPLQDDSVGTGTDASNALDIEYIFVQEEGTCGADHLYFEIKMANLVTMDANAGLGHFKEITFNLRGEEHVLKGTAITEEFTLDGETIQGDINNSPMEAYWFCAPADLLGGWADGDVVDGIWGRSAYEGGQTTDRAPDDGTGREYVIGQAEAVEVAADLLLPENRTVELVNGTGSLSFNVTNNATQDDTVFVETNVTAGWNVTVEPGNHTLAPTENGTFTVQISGNGTGPVIIGVISELGFRGSFSVNVTHAPVVDPGDGDPDEGDGDGDGNQTAEENGEDSPAPGWLVPLALAVVIAARRR